jgi:hypothetical protein
MSLRCTTISESLAAILTVLSSLDCGTDWCVLDDPIKDLEAFCGVDIGRFRRGGREEAVPDGVQGDLGTFQNHKKIFLSHGAISGMD